MELTEIIERLEQAKAHQPRKAAQRDIHRPVIINRATFQALIDQKLANWSFINNLGEKGKRYLHKCGYNGMYYGSLTQKRIIYGVLSGK